MTDPIKPFTQIVMDHTGDTRHTFDPSNAAEVKEAMERFDDLVKNQKMVAAKRTGPGTQEQIRAFDPTAEEVVFHRHLVGG